MAYSFEACLFDASKLELKRDGQRVEAQPRVLTLLAYLIENRDRLISKDELVDQLWGGRAISDIAISGRVAALRAAIGDSGKQQRLIRTIYGQGFRFVGRIDGAAGMAPKPAFGISEDPLTATGFDERPSITVLPFRLIGIAGPYSGLSLAVPDEIINALSRLRWLLVIARGSSFQFPSYGCQLDEIRIQLGAAYCLSGSVEIVGERIVITVELASTEDGTLVWTDRFETRAAGIHELRQEIVSQIINNIEFEIPAKEAERARVKETAQLSAWENYHLGLSRIFSHGPKDYIGALDNFESAVALDPQFARAFAGLGYAHWMLARQHRETDDRLSSLRFMLEATSRAVEIDPRDPFVSTMAGRAYGATGQLDLAMANCERALQIAPSYALGFLSISGLQSLSGNFEDALSNLDMSLILNPIDPNFHLIGGAKVVALLGLDRFDEAADWADRAMAHTDDLLPVLGAAVTAYHLAGRKKMASGVASKIRSIYPQMQADEFNACFPILAPGLKELVGESFKAYALITH